MAALERQHFWGCTLSKEKPEVKWLGTSEVDIGEVDVLNQLVLSQACLGSKAKDNVSHVVQVTTTGMKSNTITQPIVVLSSGIRQVQCRLEFSAAATFNLIEGNGPIHLSGSHVQVLSDHELEESEGGSEDEGIASGKQSPVKGNTKPSPSPSKQPPAKRPKLEPENDVSEGEGSSDDEEDDDDPDILVPIKDDKAKKKPAVETKKSPQKAASPGKKAKSNLLDKETEEGIGESEDEMEESDDDGDDDEKDEDFDENDSAEEEGDDDDDDDDDDESGEGEDGDESDEEESEAEDEIVNAILAKNKLRGQVNGKKTPDKKTPDRRTPQKKTPDTRTPKKTSVEASVNLEKTPDITTVKQKLLKSPNLPKKMDKFRNFMKTNMRITDEKVVKELWGWLQQNKK